MEADAKMDRSRRQEARERAQLAERDAREERRKEREQRLQKEQEEAEEKVNQVFFLLNLVPVSQRVICLIIWLDRNGKRPKRREGLRNWLQLGRL